MSNATATRWTAVLELLGQRLPPQSYQTWFQHTEVMEFTDSRLILGVPNLFVKSWIEKNYVDLIREIVREHHAAEPRVEITISPALFQAMRRTQRQESAIPVSAPGSRTDSATPANRNHPLLNPNYRMEKFVAGPSNRMAHAACMRIIDHKGEYNPLVIHGKSGMGKTHLLHGICHSLHALHPDRIVICLSAEEFLTRFTRAIATRHLDAFRKRIRTCDYLLIDDIQHLGTGNKPGTQVEFMQTIDALQNAGHQIVLTSDHPPESIKGLDPKLAGRLASGLSARIETPDQNTRCQIIHSKAAERNLILPASVVEWVAQNHPGDVRRLEGAVGRLAAMTQLEGITVDQASAMQALGADSNKDRSHEINEIVRVVAREFGLPADDLVSRRRSRRITLARQTATWIARRLTPCSLAEIGKALGNRTSPAIVQSLKKPPAEEELGGTLYERTDRALDSLGTQLRAVNLFHPQQELPWKDE